MSTALGTLCVCRTHDHSGRTGATCAIRQQHQKKKKKKKREYKFTRKQVAYTYHDQQQREREREAELYDSLISLWCWWTNRLSFLIPAPFHPRNSYHDALSHVQTTSTWYAFKVESSRVWTGQYNFFDFLQYWLICAMMIVFDAKQLTQIPELKSSNSIYDSLWDG